jgi:ferredoxin
MHYVCTLAEAKALIESQDRFWVSNCGCRESGSGCTQSRMDVCLSFDESIGGSGSQNREIDRAEAEAILQEAIAAKLVARPFRNADFTATAGICFCCQDCCGYFLDADEACDKGAYIERTDRPSCINCGLCVQVCYFKARRLANTILEINQDKCYGCGICVDVCPTGCLTMVER